MVDPELPTGTCAVAVCDKERSLTTRLGAAKGFRVSHLKVNENFNLLKSAKIVPPRQLFEPFWACFTSENVSESVCF